MSLRTRLRIRARHVASAGTLAALFPAPAFAQVTTGTAPDAYNFAGAFGAAGAGATARYAQTFQRPAAGLDRLQRFTFYLGDFAGDGSGATVSFRAAVYAVTGAGLGAVLYESGPRAGSANAVGFDAYTFTPNVSLDPSVSTFALVLEALAGSGDGALAIAAGATDYAGGRLYTVSARGALTPDPITADAGFEATLDVGPESGVVPEPATVVLVAGGLGALAAVARRRRSA